MRKKFISVITIFFLAFLLSNYWFQFVLVQGASMAPAYRSWQLVVMNKRPSDLNAGDVIVFRCDSLNAVLIKRIVACPGDTVQIENGVLYVNGADTSEFLPYRFISDAGIAETPVILNAEEYFVLGDNLEYSQDSRNADIGCIKREDILGIVLPQIPISR